MAIHPDLLEVQKNLYVPNGLISSLCAAEKESQEYGACSFEINGCRIQFRVAKITPTKIGQFVTLWKRIGAGPILPYDLKDPVDLFIVSVRTSEHFGQFVFPKYVLHEKGVISKEGKGGKRAIRVYPPWDITDSNQAKNTQKWQLLYFFGMDSNINVDFGHMQKLFTAG